MLVPSLSWQIIVYRELRRGRFLPQDDADAGGGGKSPAAVAGAGGSQAARRLRIQGASEFLVRTISVVGALTSGLLLEVNQFLGITPSFSINDIWFLRCHLKTKSELLPRQAPDKHKKLTIRWRFSCRHPVRKTALFEPFIYKMHYFTKTGSGQT